MKAALLLMAALLLAAPGFAQRALAQQQQVLRDLELAVQRLSGRLDAIEQSQANIASRLSALERGAGNSGLATKDEVAALRSDLANLRRSQESMRGEIVSDLSGKMAAIGIFDKNSNFIPDFKYAEFTERANGGGNCLAAELETVAQF